MRDKLHRLINGLRRDRGQKIITLIDAALILAAVLIVLALAETGPAR